MNPHKDVESYLSVASVSLQKALKLADTVADDETRGALADLASTCVMKLRVWQEKYKKQLKP